MKFKWKGLKLNAFVDGEIEAENKEEAMFALKKDTAELKDFIESYNISATAKLMKGKGCKVCNQTGYKGRKGEIGRASCRERV